MKQSILVIEDVAEMSELICMYLQNSNFETVPCETAELAFEKINEGYSPSLILLDLNLTGMSGLDFLKKYRESFKNTTPVIIVSARDSDEDIITGLGYGADDFVTKPFSPKVLVARVQNKLKRLAETEAVLEETISFGDFKLLTNSCILKKGSERIPLSTKEYEVLYFLCTHPDEALTPEVIYNNVWKAQYGDLTAVAVYIQRLRKKLEDGNSKPKHIITVFGSGYQFKLNWIYED